MVAALNAVHPHDWAGFLRERLERDEAVVFLASQGSEAIGFTLLYTVLMVIEIKLMLKAINKGPDEVLPSLQAPAASAAPSLSQA